ncbi:hypothetical protein CYMTET_4616 [Cymbomonas tetramitiformis]|uniref:Reverse transcriptase RNase H-like domain-containing protein n=1 Tax=Cymbomonas tetramitiformis TaxID=36881 RepID=A0AAE0LJW2_9CHLO|nr:hypothetical protein CYMTET_4616 [Cymbomonas tetramitiformis]
MLTKNDVEWKWGPEQQWAFEELKAALVDAPDCGEGLKVIAYESRQFSTAEQNYHTGERELCGLHHCTTVTWRHYLIFTAFKLQGDHRPLESPMEPGRELSRRQARWYMDLVEVGVPRMEYVKGALLLVPDALSRTLPRLAEVDSWLDAVDTLQLAELVMESHTDAGGVQEHLDTDLPTEVTTDAGGVQEHLGADLLTEVTTDAGGVQEHLGADLLTEVTADAGGVQACPGVGLPVKVKSDAGGVPECPGADLPVEATAALMMKRHMHLIPSPLVFFQSLDVVSPECGAFVEMAVNVLQVLNQACGIERINKNADMVHSKARASFRLSNVRKAIYCFTNLVLQFKLKVSFREYLTTVLPVDEQDEVLLSFENELDSSDDELPASTAAPQEEEEEEDMDTTEPELVDHRKVFDCPTGFKALEKPATFLSSAETLTGLFILMLWEAEGWELGKLMNYAPKRSKYGKFDVDACCGPDERDRLVNRYWDDCLQERWKGLNVWCTPSRGGNHLTVEAVLCKYVQEWRLDPENTSAAFLLPDIQSRMPQWRKLFRRAGMRIEEVIPTHDSDGNPNQFFAGTNGKPQDLP